MTPSIISTIATCLNPCFSGTYSQSVYVLNGRDLTEGLNPCFSGTYSQSIMQNNETGFGRLS